MKTIWLVNPYGPIEGEQWRDYSFNQFGKYLSNHEYNVIWWTSNFAHHFKKFRSESWSDIVINSRYIIRLVPTCSYKRNISLGRFMKDVYFAKEATKRFIECEKPNLIIEYLNPLTMGSPTYKYSKHNNIPIIVDQMDIWPEFIENQSSPLIKPILHLLFQPVFKRRVSIYKNASGIMALGKHYLEFAMNIIKDNENKPSALVYNGIDTNYFRNLMYSDLPEKIAILEKKENEIWLIFAGTFGHSYDINNIIRCAKRSERDGRRLMYIFAGSGPLMNDIQQAEKILNNVTYLGALPPEQLASVYAKCDIGLSTYSSGSNVDMPDKFYDYTAAGLAVINSLKGEVHEFIDKEKVGINYEGGNEESMYSAIIRISRSKDALKIMRQNSWRLGGLFDSEKQNHHLLELIEKVLN